MMKGMERRHDSGAKTQEPSSTTSSSQAPRHEVLRAQGALAIERALGGSYRAMVATEHDPLNLREGPSLDQPVRGHLPRLEIIDVLGPQKDGFLEVEHHGRRGW